MRHGMIRLPANLWISPRVARLAELMRRPRSTVIGSLIRLWTTCETHGSERGSFLKFATPATLDRLTAEKGFGRAMLEIQAIEPTDAGLKILWSNKPKSSRKTITQLLPTT
jgi:hypothetical protein